MRRVFALAVLMIFPVFLAATCRSAQPQIAGVPTAQSGSAELKGSVTEVLHGGGYTYAKLQAPGRDEVWIAASEFATRPGDRLTVALEMPMTDFESKTLKRTFPLIYFVSSVSRDGSPVGVHAETSVIPQMMTSREPPGAAPGEGRVEPAAPPPGGLSIAQVWAQRHALSGQVVTVRGTVVKANNGILNTNWVHLQDGSGSAADRTNDLTLMTDALVGPGEVITVRGVIAVNKDIGDGYRYEVILERAQVVK